MRFTQDLSSNVNVIRGYDRGELRVNDQVFRDSLLVGPNSIQAMPALTTVAELGDDVAAHILELQPEVVLLGTGPRQIFPAPGFGARFLRSGVGFEVMDTGAACRTFNVLVGELRRAVALLLI